MKKLLLITSALIVTSAMSFGQGAITWGNNFTGFRALIFAPQTENPFLSLVGQSGGFYGGTTTVFQDNPVGTQTYTGALLSGTRYTFAIFTAPVGALSNSLTLLGSTTFNTSSSTVNGGNVLPKGYVPSRTDTVAGVPVGAQLTYQIRVWDNLNGTLTSWALANEAWLNQGSIALGYSPLLTLTAGGTDPGGNIIPTPNTTQFTSFNIWIIPEPGMLSVAGLGAAVMLILRRRK